MQMVGQDAYTSQAVNIVKAARQMWQAAKETAGVEVIEQNEDSVMTHVLFKPTAVDAWLLADALEDQGWPNDRIYPHQKAIAIKVNPVNSKNKAKFGEALKRAMEAAKKGKTKTK